ncbi:MAG: hypothetical protein ACI8WB_004868, partial [Phenylobacterium sp.]
MILKFATLNLYQFAEPPVAWYEPFNIYTNDEWTFKHDWLSKQIAAT